MAGMKGLVEGECGGANPLMQLTKAYHTEMQEQFHIGSQNGQIESVPPQTFDMEKLLKEINKTERITNSHNGLKNEIIADWRNEYMQLEKQLEMTEDNTYKSPEVKMKYNNLPQVLYPNNSLPHFPVRLMQPPNLVVADNQTEKWAHEYLDDAQVENDDSTNLQKTAKEIIESVENQAVSDTDFMKFMNQIKDGKTLEEEDTKKVESVDDWIRQYEATGSEDALEGEQLIDPTTQGDKKYWEKLRKDWDELFRQERFQSDSEDSIQGYLSDYAKEYEFEENNPFNGIANPFEEGMKKLQAGDLISAILLFEEAVTLNPSHAEAWQYLGTSQAENEQETLAIRALNKCTELQPNNLIARMALSVSYTNESLQTQACNSLKSWIQHHPRYSHLTSGDSSLIDSKYTPSLMTSEMFQEVQQLYLAAARLAPSGDIDAEIQVGLGVLFNISGDYEKAVDCFQTALKASPKDATIWNKLGATLANSGRSAEAIEAYSNALSLRPGFIRCRYNLGISCINLKAYNEAIQHLLSALNMQKQGEDPNRPASTMSENIWTTLRMTISLLGK